MNLGPRGNMLIKGFEKLRLKAYKDSKGIWTIGYGHTGPDVYEGLTCTEEQADRWFTDDAAWASRAISDAVTVSLEQSQFDALVSFTFNVGVHAFKESTLLKMINSEQFLRVPGEMCKWRFSGSQELLGLLRRRVDEARLFLADI